jgi:glutathione S-transferase
VHISSRYGHGNGTPISSETEKKATSIADICLASLLVVMRVFKINVSETPTIDRIMAACESLAAFASADLLRQVSAPAVD